LLLFTHPVTSEIYTLSLHDALPISWNFGPFERAFLLEAGTDPELIQALAEAWPNPGTLPYAEYDNRTRDMLMERDLLRQWKQGRDRKSTRLNSSHLGISYAVFCLKK